MTLTRRSLALLALAALLAVLNLWGGGGPAAVEALPVLPAAVADTVAVLQVSTPIEKLRIERVSMEKGAPGFDRWRIVTPLDFPADTAQIQAVIATFAGGLPMDAFVDGGNHEDYGVDDQNGLLVELFGAGAELPTVSVMVGKTAAGPSTFVRIPGAEAVYRADVGGRARYARPAGQWRDKVALDLDPDKVVGLTLARAADTLTFTRGASPGADGDGKPLPTPWQLDPAAAALLGGPVDDETLRLTVRALARIRAAEIHNPDYAAGFDAPAAVGTLRMEDGTTHVVTLGARVADGNAFVRVAGRDEVFRTPGNVGRALTQPLQAFQDRRLLTFARGDVSSIAYVDRGLTVVLEQSEDGASWAVTQPPNMDADQQQALLTVNTLAALRATAVAPDTRFDATGARFQVRFRDGRTVALELGQVEPGAENRALVRVRVAGQPGVYLLREAVLSELRKAFGRG